MSWDTKIAPLSQKTTPELPLTPRGYFWPLVPQSPMSFRLLAHVGEDMSRSARYNRVADGCKALHAGTIPALAVNGDSHTGQHSSVGCL
jgi:hypothetical protein